MAMFCSEALRQGFVLLEAELDVCEMGKFII